MYKPFALLFTLLFWQGKGLTQAAYNNCSQALELCPGQTYAVNNIGANKTFCPDCEDDFNFCFTANNTIWFKFKTNASGGNAEVRISDLQFQQGAGQGNSVQASMLNASIPCQSNTYTTLGNCVVSEISDFSLTVNALAPNTTYYVVVNGGNGSTSPAEVRFNIAVQGVSVDRPSPTILLDKSITNLCSGQSYQGIAQLQNCPNPTNYQWFINGNLTALTSDASFTTSNLMDGDVISVKTNCYAQCPQIVTDSSIPLKVNSFLLDAGPDLFLKQGESLQIQASSNAKTYVWSPGFHISDSLSLTPYVSPKETTTYTLTGIENGCTQFDYVTVFVEDFLTFPTTFSPNGDGINDTWEIPGVESFPNCYVQIYDRWGQAVFQALGYNGLKAWDGTYKDGNVTEGVYYYVVKLRDAEQREYKGSVTLIR